MKKKCNYFEKLEEYIQIIENVMPNSLCYDIISEYENSNEWKRSETFGGLNPKVRNCMSIPISTNKTLSLNLEKRKKIDDDIFSIVSEVLSNWNKNYGTSLIKDNGYDLLRYNEGGFYTQHIDDDGHDYRRTISCSLCLNDDYEGGEFSFFNRNLSYKLKKGSIISFPSNFMFPHEIMPVHNGVRYSIITWLV